MRSKPINKIYNISITLMDTQIYQSKQINTIPVTENFKKKTLKWLLIQVY